MLPPPLRFPRAVLFDMDGTLTRDTIDYDAIRADLGVGPSPILEWIDNLPAEHQPAAHAKLQKWEAKFSEESELNEGCIDLLDWLTERGVPTALITRNTRSSVQTVLQKHGLQFAVQITREDGKFKPDPAPLLIACDRLGVSAADAWMVGDWKYDIEAATAAKMTSIWLTHGRSPRPFDAEPTYAVRDLCELVMLLDKGART